MKDFKGIISDVGGPTANMYGYECVKKKILELVLKIKRCVDAHRLCRTMKVDHSRNIQLLKDIRAVPGIKKHLWLQGLDMI